MVDWSKDTWGQDGQNVTYAETGSWLNGEDPTEP